MKGSGDSPCATVAGQQREENIGGDGIGPEGQCGESSGSNDGG